MKFSTVLFVLTVLVGSYATAQSSWQPARPGTPGGGNGSIGRASTTDPTGDTFGSGSPQHDITEFRAVRSGTDLIITLTFAGNISAGDSGQPNALVGYVDLDVDQDGATGIVGFADNNCPSMTGLGVEFEVDLFSYDSSTEILNINDVQAVPVGAATAVFSTNSVTITVPFSEINSPDGIVDTVTVVGTFAEATDCAPDGAGLTVPVELQSFEIE